MLKEVEGENMAVAAPKTVNQTHVLVSDTTYNVRCCSENYHMPLNFG